MKVIDLVEQITLKNIPKRIKYNDYEWEYDGENYKIQASSGTHMNWDYIIFNCLNEDVEIIEESQPTKEEPQEYKIPEKIKMRVDSVGDINNKIENLNLNQMIIEDKINEILDYLEVNNG